MASLALELALITLFSSVKTETKAQIITVPVELHTTVDLPCSCTLCPESTIGVQWYRSSNSDAFIKDGKALTWWSKKGTGSSEGFGIKDDFSMIIYNLTDQHDQDWYRCIVIPDGDAAESTHDVKLGIYANLDTYPVIEYTRQTNGFNVTCSISNIFPMTFPILTTKEGIVTEYNNSDKTYNRDGTFNTNVTLLIPANEKDTIIECLYSNLNFKSVSSLRIAESDTIGQPEEGNGMRKNMTHTDLKRAPSGLWMVWMIFIIKVLFFIVIAIKRGRVLLNHALRKTIHKNTADKDQDEHLGETSKEEEPAKSIAILLFETSGQIITVPVELHTTVDFPCSCTLCPESTIGVQWYRSSDSDAFRQDGQAITWWSEGGTGSSQGFGIKDDFSMIATFTLCSRRPRQPRFRTPWTKRDGCETTRGTVWASVTGRDCRGCRARLLNCQKMYHGSHGAMRNLVGPERNKT